MWAILLRREEYHHFPTWLLCLPPQPSYKAPLRAPHALHTSSLPPLPCLLPWTYHAGLFQGQGTIWNLSCTGWRLSSDLPIRPGETLSLIVTLPIFQHPAQHSARFPHPFLMLRLYGCTYFPIGDTLLNGIRSFLRRLSSTPVSSQSLKEPGFCAWEFGLMVHLKQFTSRHHAC
jgi:hypothetical protein